MSDQPPEALARELAPFGELEMRYGSRGQVVLGRTARFGVGRVGGEVYDNDGVEVDWRTNDERSLIDAFLMVFDVAYTGRDLEIQLQEARALFAELTAAPLAMALVNGYDFLLAISDPKRGVVMMPEGTTPYEEHRSVWLPHLVALIDG